MYELQPNVAFCSHLYGTPLPPLSHSAVGGRDGMQPRGPDKTPEHPALAQRLSSTSLGSSIPEGSPLGVDQDVIEILSDMGMLAMAPLLSGKSQILLLALLSGRFAVHPKMNVMCFKCPLVVFSVKSSILVAWLAGDMCRQPSARADQSFPVSQPTTFQARRRSQIAAWASCRASGSR